jgi:hypothetical protein
MLDQFGDDPFKRLKDRIRLRLKQEMVEEQMLGVLNNAYAEVLRTENIVLTRKERERLLREVLKDTLDDMLRDLSDRG